MSDRRILAICIFISLLLHLAAALLLDRVRLSVPPSDEVVVVDLADLPRSPDFLPPEPGVLEGVSKPPQPSQEAMTGTVPDRPVDTGAKPEKSFPAVTKPPQETPREKQTVKTPIAEEKAAGEPVVGKARDHERGDSDEKKKPAEPPKKEPSPAVNIEKKPDVSAPGSGKPKKLKELTPTLGRIVMAERERGGRGDGDSSGVAVGTGGKAAAKGEISEERGGAHLTPLNAPEIKYISYFASIKRKIELVWTFPDAAKRAGIQGDVVVNFAIARNGELESAEIVRSSGHRVLDEEALDSIRRSAPFNPIPAEYSIPTLEIRAHFVYEIHNLRLR